MIIMGEKVKRLYVSVQCTVMFSVFSVKNKLANLKLLITDPLTH